MRSFVVMGMFVASLASADFSGHTEARDLQLSTDGINVFELDTGSGSLTIKGIPDADDIQVKALIRVDDDDEGKARRRIASDVTLTLVKSHDRAKLRAEFDNTFWHGNQEGLIDLEIEMPAGLNLNVDDGSGSIEISDVMGDIEVDDGSGPIVIHDVGNIRIDDGSGPINVAVAGGNVSIDDGSGEITVERVGGNVIIDDGSGKIDVSDVEHDLIIIDDGSGGLSVLNVRGSVKK